MVHPSLPRTVNEYLSAFMKFELRDIEPRRQLTYYPFASSVFDNIRIDNQPRIGTDLYWRPTTNTLVSATLNPDFGTVEDDVIVNLTAFEQFFPERRVFFLKAKTFLTTHLPVPLEEEVQEGLFKYSIQGVLAGRRVTIYQKESV